MTLRQIPWWSCPLEQGRLRPIYKSTNWRSNLLQESVPSSSGVYWPCGLWPSLRKHVTSNDWRLIWKHRRWKRLWLCGWYCG